MSKLLKNFRERINEAEARPLVITFGRFNPPTIGHEKLIKAVEKKASKENADFRIYPSHSQDPKKNPLSRTDKVKFMRKMFRKYARNIIDDAGAKTMLDVAVKSYKEGYRKLFVVVGAPEVPMFNNLLKKYNGVDARHGFYDFEEIEVVSAGNRTNPDSDDAKKMTADTMSASVLRKLAADGDFDTFKLGVPDSLGEVDKRVLFNKIRVGMKLAAINEAFEHLFEQNVVIVEKAPPDEKIQKWLEDPATKADFKKRYNDDWEEIMYATAWKIFNDKKGISESWNIDDEMEEDWSKVSGKKLSEFRARLKNEVKQDSDIKDKKGTQPAKYFAGDMAKSTKEKRAAQFAKQAKMDDDDPRAYKPAPGDASAKTKPSQYTKKYNKMFGEELVTEVTGLIHIFEDSEGEGRMVKSDLSKMIRQAQELMRLIGDEDDLPAWAQSKFAIATDYINAVHGYLTYNNEAPRLEEFIFEAISKADLAQIEKYADRLFAAVGIDVNFTRHFLDRVNDSRNGKEITNAELTRLFKQSYKTYGKKIAQLGPDAEAVINDMMTDINMPFILKWDSVDQELDLVAKTVMRKKNFHSPDKKFVVAQAEFDLVNEEKLDEDTEKAIKNKADETGISYAILKKVFDRGVAAWKSGHRPGTTAIQWGLARINSFATGGKTRTTADADLWAKHSGKKEALEYGTQETTDNYKDKTPGEMVDEETMGQYIEKILSKTIKKKPYEVALEILQKVWDRKKQFGRHSIEYYAAEIAKQVRGNVDARTLAKMVKEDFNTGLTFALDNEKPLHEVYRPYSEEFYKLYRDARKEQVYPTEFDKKLIETTDIGKFGFYEGDAVPLDLPMVDFTEEKEPELNKPKRGGDKKFYVYVRNDKGNVVKVQFGDTTGLKAKINDPEARKSFVARHQCDTKKDKTTPGYWACRLPYYAKELGLEGGGDFFW